MLQTTQSLRLRKKKVLSVILRVYPGSTVNEEWHRLGLWRLLKKISGNYNLALVLKIREVDFSEDLDID